MFKPFTLFPVADNTNARPIPDERLCYSCREAEAACGLLCLDCIADLARARAAAQVAPNVRSLPAEFVCSSCREARPVRNGLCRDCLTDVSGVFDAPRGLEEHPAE